MVYVNFLSDILRMQLGEGKMALETLFFHDAYAPNLVSAILTLR